MPFDHLPEDQARLAQQLYQSLKTSTDHDLMAIAELLATRPDDRLFGQTEFDLRDLVHRLGAQALQAAALQRKKGATKAPA
jgi:hypothetical protein